ncbi:hypothetical protein ABW19_dt0201288 [Dactylella cylindrospora]|nr:hypothetical protein ABW19_dt0201288 [Dactylella cylindrospora]
MATDGKMSAKEGTLEVTGGSAGEGETKITQPEQEKNNSQNDDKKGESVSQDNENETEKKDTKENGKDGNELRGVEKQDNESQNGDSKKGNEIENTSDAGKTRPGNDTGKESKNLILAVSGMTCTGCENKLAKALGLIPGVIERGPKKVKTNFMQGRADIWYIPNMIKDPEEGICNVIHKKTGYRCIILSNINKNEGGEYRNAIQVKVCLPDGVHSDSIQEHTQALQGVKRVLELPEPHYHKTIQDFLPNALFWWRSPPTPDLEKGIDTREWKTYDVQYDPRSVNAREIMQHVQNFSQPPLTIQLADAEEPDQIVAEQGRSELRRLLWRTLLAALLTIPILVITWTPSIKTRIPAAGDMNRSLLGSYIALHTVCLILATLVQLCGFEIFTNAFRSVVWQHELDMDCLITISTTAAYIYSCIYYGFNISREARKLLTGRPPTGGESERHDPIFEASSLLITLILAGRLLTGYIRHWATTRISVSSLQQKFCRRSLEVTLAPAENRTWITEDVRLLHYGDVIMVKTGENIVTDGVVINGIAAADESHLTGEAKPAHLQNDSTVIAGSKVIEGTIEYRVTRLVNENTISSMKTLVSTASNARPRLQDYADKVAAWLTPSILLFTIVVCISWIIYYRVAKSATEDLKSAISKAVITGITILAVSCPCAIALAVPTVLMFATQVGVKNGIVIKEPTSLEKASKIRYFVADKTGTLTTGKLQVATAKYWVHGRWLEDNNYREVQEIQRTIYKLTVRDRHPVAQAIAQRIKGERPEDDLLSGEDYKVESIIGNGIEGIIDGRLLRGGKPSWALSERLRKSEIPVIREIEKALHTPFVVVDVKLHTIIAIFGLYDIPRPEAASVIKKLTAQGIQCFMLSGDQKAVCKDIAKAIGIPESNVFGECSPQQKATRIQMLQYQAKEEFGMFKLRGNWFIRILRKLFKTERKYVMFLGDGTNDAAALKHADVGVTMSNCTEIAAGCADIGIVSSSLTGVLAITALSTRAMSLIRCNFGWALKYNITAMLISTGVVQWSIPPQYAGIGEAVSVAPVFIIASALVWWKLRY